MNSNQVLVVVDVIFHSSHHRHLQNGNGLIIVCETGWNAMFLTVNHTTAHPKTAGTLCSQPLIMLLYAWELLECVDLSYV